MLKIINTKIYGIKYFLCLTTLFSINIYASTDLKSLSQQLNSSSGYAQAFIKLKEIANQDQTALVPMFSFFCSDFVTQRGTAEYRKTHAVSKFLQEYAATHKLDESILNSLFTIKKKCSSKSGIEYYKLAYVLEKNSAMQRYSDNILDKLIKTTSSQIIAERNNRSNYATIYFRALKNQTKHRRLPDKARRLAIQVIGDNANSYGVIYPILDMLIGQLKYNDKKSEKSLIKMMQPSNSPALRMSVTQRLASWYEKQGKLNSFVKKILVFRDREKNKEVEQFYRKLLVRLNRNKQISPEVGERIFLLARSKKEKYGANVALMRAYTQKSKTSALTDSELKSVLRALSGSNWVAMIDASKTIASLDAAGHINKKLHEDLIKLYFAPNISARGLHDFKKVVMENIPYRNVEKKYQYNKYPDALLVQVIQYARIQGSKIPALTILNFMREVYKHQLLPEEVVAGLYEIYSRQNSLKLKIQFSELLIRYYKETDYIRIGLFASGLGSNSLDYQKKVHTIVLEALRKEDSLNVGLYKMFSDRTLNNSTRKYFLQELVKENFNYAAKEILLPDDEAEKIQEIIWEVFYRNSYNRKGQVDEQTLRAATKSENFKIRHTAWRMLERQGISTPFLVKWERELFRAQVYSSILFFGGGPLSFILGSLLLLRMRKGMQVKHKWMNAGRYIVWVIITSSGFIAGMGMIFVMSLGHSSVLSLASHEVLDKGFGSIFAAYLITALVVRLLIPIVPIKK